MPETAPIAIADLLLDSANARLGQEQANQQTTCLALAKREDKRLIKLAEDIVNYGVDPTTLTVVAPTGDRRQRYKVLEGNRRVLALKALETPSLITSVLQPAQQRKLGDLSIRFHKRPIDEITCVVFDDESDVRHWIELRHTGENGGAGLVEWNSNDQDRYRARHGGVGARQPAGQVIDFVDKIDGKSDPNAKILSSVKRLISTPDVRDRLGIDVIDGRVVSHYPAEETAKGLRRIVDDLREKKVLVNDIYYVPDRLEYLAKFSNQDLPDSQKKLKSPVALDGLAAGRRTKVARKVTAKVPVKAKVARTALIPGTCSLNISPPRISYIYNELLTLNMEQYPNATAVLLRVFLELSVDSEISSSTLMNEQTRRTTPLAKRLKIVAQHLRTSGRIDSQLEAAIKMIADNQNVIAASAVAFNQYVHNQYAYPKPSELRLAWDELQPFIEKLWP